MSRAATLTVAAVLAGVLAMCGFGVVVLAAFTGSGCGNASPSASTRWNDEQVGHATTIVAVGARIGVPSFGWVVAVATAIQESGLRNLGYLGERNDHDSLGLFQQRPSQGWGTPAQVTDPTYAATAFYTKLLQVPGWQQLPLTEAAQAVQRSAFPDAYAKHEADARALVATITGRLGLAGDCPAGGWVNPLPPGSYTLTSPFGPRWGTHHDGQDFAAPTGTPIHAAAAGTVLAAGCTSPFCDRPGDIATDGTPTTRGCGWRAVVDHGHGVATVYCHAQALSVHNGQSVAAGQVIGWVGSTGNSTGAHLHFEVHQHTPIDLATATSSSTAIDPVGYLRSVGVQL